MKKATKKVPVDEFWLQTGENLTYCPLKGTSPGQLLLAVSLFYLPFVPTVARRTVAAILLRLDSPCLCHYVDCEVEWCRLDLVPQQHQQRQSTV